MFVLLNYLLRLLLDVGFPFFDIQNLCVTILGMFINLYLLLQKIQTESLCFFLEENKICCVQKYSASMCQKFKSSSGCTIRFSAQN